MIKRKNTEAHPAGTVTLAALGERMRLLREERQAVIAQIIEREKAGEFYDPTKRPDAERQRAAVGKLNGEAGPLAEKLAKAGRTLTELRDDLAIIDLSLEEGDRLFTRISGEEAERRRVEMKPELNNAIRQVCIALVNLDRALRARDAVVLKMKYPVPIGGIGWPLSGRLHNTGSQSYQFLDWATREGAFSKEEFEAELRAARAEHGDRPVHWG